MRKQGTVTRWDEVKGFGFIHNPQAGNQLFFHIRDWRGSATPSARLQVSFEEIHVGGKGPRAMDVRPESDRPAAPAPSNHKVTPQAVHTAGPPHRGQAPRRARPSRQDTPALPALALMLVWTGLLLAGVALGRMGWLILPAAFILNLVTFYAYWRDKFAATQGAWRTKEDTLHLFGLLGGWPGAWFAHQILRHKSVKQAFRNVYWTTAIVNVIALGAWVLLPWLPLTR
jgi:uncharacterized membrane protein YsdA (DUF1294 family)/cold shock CspA family protein